MSISLQPSTFSAIDAPDPGLISTCIHCGMCLPECPTYRALRVETDSPRGRIELVRAVHEGRLELEEPSFSEHIFLCLDCRGCESACPSGVEYGQIIEAARAQATMAGNLPPGLEAANRLMRLILSRIWLLRLLARGLRITQQLGLDRLIGPLQRLRILPPGLARAARAAPRVSASFCGQGDLREFPARGRRRYRVGLLTGCIMQVAFGDVNRATLEVLAENGCEVVLPSAQGCCGGLSWHNGDRATARAMARRNVRAFDRDDLDAVVINSAGCGSSAKEWAEMLELDERLSAAAERVRAKTYDLSEWLARIGLVGDLGPVNARVCYQDACHLRHAQKITEQPRALLAGVPGLELVEPDRSFLCCGNAGIYSLLNPDVSEQVRSEKLDTIEATAADRLVTTNPGCQMHLGQGLDRRGNPMRVQHLAELLAESYARGREPGQAPRN